MMDYQQNIDLHQMTTLNHTMSAHDELQTRYDAAHSELVRMTEQLAACRSAANELKQQRDELQQQLAGMTDSAKHFSGGMEYYRDLIDEAAKSIGITMYTADDQGVHPDPLRAKLPECVAELVQQRDELLTACETFVEWLDREDAGFIKAGNKRETPEDEKRWREWYDGNLALCSLAQEQARAAIANVKEQK